MASLYTCFWKYNFRLFNYVVWIKQVYRSCLFNDWIVDVINASRIFTMTAHKPEKILFDEIQFAILLNRWTHAASQQNSEVALNEFQDFFNSEIFRNVREAKLELLEKLRPEKSSNTLLNEFNQNLIEKIEQLKREVEECK